jgi:hypothetical protein
VAGLRAVPHISTSPLENENIENFSLALAYGVYRLQRLFVSSEFKHDPNG